MKRKYVGSRVQIKQGSICDITVTYHPGFDQYSVVAVVEPYREVVTLYYDSREQVDKEWTAVLEES